MSHKLHAFWRCICSISIKPIPSTGSPPLAHVGQQKWHDPAAPGPRSQCEQWDPGPLKKLATNLGQLMVWGLVVWGPVVWGAVVWV